MTGHVPDSALAGELSRRSRTRSFARRGGRMPHAHRTAYEALAARYVVEVPRPLGDGSTMVDTGFTLDVPALFGRSAPLVVEVGSGSGDAVLAAARDRSDHDFLALEVWRPGNGQALARMLTEPLPNVRFVELDAAQALASLLAPGSVSEVWTFFPDPWPKARHAKRRLVQPGFADTVAAVLARGCLWRLATDWAEYAAHIRAVLDPHENLQLISTDRAPLRPVTRFERKGTVAGREILDLAYRRR